MFDCDSLTSYDTSYLVGREAGPPFPCLSASHTTLIGAATIYTSLLPTCQRSNITLQKPHTQIVGQHYFEYNRQVSAPFPTIFQELYQVANRVELQSRVNAIRQDIANRRAEKKANAKIETAEQRKAVRHEMLMLSPIRDVGHPVGPSHCPTSAEPSL